MARDIAHCLEHARITDAVMISETCNHALSGDGVLLEIRAMFVSWLHRERFYSNFFAVARSLLDSSRFRLRSMPGDRSYHFVAESLKRSRTQQRDNQCLQLNS